MNERKSLPSPKQGWGRVLAILLVLAMIVGFVPVLGSAVENAQAAELEKFTKADVLAGITIPTETQLRNQIPEFPSAPDCTVPTSGATLVTSASSSLTVSAGETMVVSGVSASSIYVYVKEGATLYVTGSTIAGVIQEGNNSSVYIVNNATIINTVTITGANCKLTANSSQISGIYGDTTSTNAYIHMSNGCSMSTGGGFLGPGQVELHGASTQFYMTDSSIAARNTITPNRGGADAIRAEGDNQIVYVKSPSSSVSGIYSYNNLNTKFYIVDADIIYNGICVGVGTTAWVTGCEFHNCGNVYGQYGQSPSAIESAGVVYVLSDCNQVTANTSSANSYTLYTKAGGSLYIYGGYWNHTGYCDLINNSGTIFIMDGHFKGGNTIFSLFEGSVGYVLDGEFYNTASASCTASAIHNRRNSTLYLLKANIHGNTGGRVINGSYAPVVIEGTTYLGNTAAYDNTGIDTSVAVWLECWNSANSGQLPDDWLIIYDNHNQDLHLDQLTAYSIALGGGAPNFKDTISTRNGIGSQTSVMTDTDEANGLSKADVLIYNNSGGFGGALYMVGNGAKLIPVDTAPSTYKVTYKYESADSNALPKDVTDLLTKTSEDIKIGSTAIPPTPAKTTVTVTGGKWTWNGWDQATASSAHDFVGTWTYTKDVVNYTIAMPTPGYKVLLGKWAETETNITNSCNIDFTVKSGDTSAPIGSITVEKAFTGVFSGLDNSKVSEYLTISNPVANGGGFRITVTPPAGSESVRSCVVKVTVKCGEAKGEYIIVVPGDTNASGEINSGDVTALKKVVNSYDDEPKKLAEGGYLFELMDINGSGDINSGDVTNLKKMVNNYITSN